jgi:hypothetical protein
MTRLRRARIALYAVAFANVALIAATWPRPPRITEWAVLLLCPGAVALAYREDPARFHGEVDKRFAIRLMLGPVIVVAILIVLARTRVL